MSHVLTVTPTQIYEEDEKPVEVVQLLNLISDLLQVYMIHGNI